MNTDTNEEKLAPVELTNKYDGTQLKNAVDDEISRVRIESFQKKN